MGVLGSMPRTPDRYQSMRILAVAPVLLRSPAIRSHRAMPTMSLPRNNGCVGLIPAALLVRRLKDRIYLPKLKHPNRPPLKGPIATIAR